MGADLYLMTAEHLHLALNHLPIIGLACALLPILTGVAVNNKTTLLVGLLLAALCGWSTPFVMETGEHSYERYESGTVARYLDPEVGIFMNLHAERADKGSKAMIAAAVLATLCLPLTWWRMGIGRWVSVLVALACLLSVVGGIWIADSGGKIRRVDFRGSTTLPVE
jgi:L-asparagine transporter-like permease